MGELYHSKASKSESLDSLSTRKILLISSVSWSSSEGPRGDIPWMLGVLTVVDPTWVGARGLGLGSL